MEIYHVASGPARWDIFPMASNPEKKAAAERRAKALYTRLMKLDRPDPSFSNNAWTEKAGVSSSFFTNLQGNKKPASEPTVGNLRMVLEAVGVSLPEFFAHEAQGKLVEAPSRRALEEALVDALPRMPKRQAERAPFLAEAVLGVLALPETLSATPSNDQTESRVGREEGAPARAATKRT